MKSTKYKHRNIQRTLELLKKTDHPAWRGIRISLTNTQAWDVDGDLADTLVRDGSNVVYEVDEDGNEVDDNAGPQTSDDNTEVNVLNDGGDRGPAELQNTEPEDTMYEGVFDLGASTDVAHDNAHLAAEATENAVREFHSNAMRMRRSEEDIRLEDDDLSDVDFLGPIATTG
ncbi:hypothetical protein THAOC_14878 [Thalassiosira oceanica]|uniref:Uncharacterized protein n=1 Tax=Thalassiosira oceanica TaxID=159749 RepID=K0SGA7_THAOC|nr:hypothetical protein THAOC_14878 [Thalassiosira oceanica]|eukprot:EJK64390.1 hypothetical protein THAOC_14878 [Thalassiosira oceanica]